MLSQETIGLKIIFIALIYVADILGGVLITFANKEYDPFLIYH